MKRHSARKPSHSARRKTSRRVRKKALAGLGSVRPVVTSDLGAARFAGLPLWAWAGMGAVAVGGGIWVYVATRRKGMTFTPEQKNAFLSSLPDHVKPYGPAILAAGEEQGVSPFTIYALGDRETQWGRASAYKQDTGDWAPRERKLADAQAKPQVYKILANTERVNESGEHVVKVMPADGLGWGRGLMQIDWEWQNSWVRKNNWKDPYTNIRYGTTYLRQLLDLFGSKKSIGKIANGASVTVANSFAVSLNQKLKRNDIQGGQYADPRPLGGQNQIAAAIAAYNTGPGNAIRSLALGLPAEASTTGGDYTADTMRRQDELIAAFQAAGGGAVATA